MVMLRRFIICCFVGLFGWFLRFKLKKTFIFKKKIFEVFDLLFFYEFLIYLIFNATQQINR